MKRFRREFRSRLLVTTLACIATGCSSGFVSLSPRMPATATPLGHATGRACGMIVPYAGAEQFLPLMVPSRLDRAYERALQSVPGATTLQDVTIQDDWLWAIVGLYMCTTISGEATR